MVKSPERRRARVTIRLPEDLRAAIEREAERDRRSPSDWIVLVLQDAITARAAKKGGR